jgi:hypothetical protein
MHRNINKLKTFFIVCYPFSMLEESVAGEIF